KGAILPCAPRFRPGSGCISLPPRSAGDIIGGVSFLLGGRMNSPADPQLSNREIFLAAAELSDPVRRRSYLDQVCGSNAERRVWIERLLAARGAEATNPLDQAVAWLD